MAKKVEKPAEQGAPAYMIMYTSLMMLLLAFFIAIISMATASSQRGGLNPGIGAIRNSFGIQGGLGLLPYIKVLKNLRAAFPRASPNQEADASQRVAIGYDKDALRRDMLVDNGFLSIKTVYRGLSLRITTPLVFARGKAVLNEEAREFLQRIGGILNSFPEGFLTVRAYVAESGQADQDELLASERAAAIVRYLEQQSGIAPTRLNAVGSASPRYLGTVAAGRDQAVVFLINKLIERQALPAKTGDAPRDNKTGEGEDGKGTGSE